MNTSTTLLGVLALGALLALAGAMYWPVLFVAALMFATSALTVAVLVPLCDRSDRRYAEQTRAQIRAQLRS